MTLFRGQVAHKNKSWTLTDGINEYRILAYDANRYRLKLGDSMQGLVFKYKTPFDGWEGYIHSGTLARDDERTPTEADMLINTEAAQAADIIKTSPLASALSSLPIVHESSQDKPRTLGAPIRIRVPYPRRAPHTSS